MEIFVEINPSGAWDGTYPRFMRDIQNDDIILVNSYDLNAYNGTRIFDGAFDEVAAGSGRWVKRRLEHVSAVIKIYGQK